MSITELIKSGANITLAVSATDLKEWHREVIENTKKELEGIITDANTETYPSAEKVCEILDINKTTLWRWEKKGYLVPANVGGKRRYKMSEIKAILEGGR